MQMPRDIGHPYPQGEPVYDVTFENVQAGERTSHLFRLTNFHNAMVGTGDLSELALGWATYGVGDQMSHYHVNASVPKTLIQHLVRWVAESGQLDARVNTALRSILETEISPELIPGAAATRAASRAVRRSSGRSSSRTSISTTSRGSAFDQARLRTSRSVRGGIVTTVLARARSGGQPTRVRPRHDCEVARSLSSSILQDQSIQAIGGA